MNSINLFPYFLYTFLWLVIRLIIVILLIILILVGIKALLKYINSSQTRNETLIIKKSLGEVIKHHRTRCKMTQEFVAERMGVSRQTISKWENGINEPSTSHLLKLAKLFDVDAEDLLREIKF